MLSVTALNPDNDLNTFLDFLYKPTDEGYIYAPTKDVETGGFHQQFFKWPVERDKLVEWVKATTPNSEVYIAPALFSQPSAQKESFKLSNVLWTEFDGNFPASFGDVPEPSLRVQSSDIQHQHVYWALDPSETITDSTEIEAYNRALTYSLGADASAWDCNQVLRPPGTINHKRDVTTILCYLGDGYYSRSRFNRIDVPASVYDGIDASTIPDVTDVIYKYEFPQEVTDLIRSSDVSAGNRSTALMRLGFYCAEMGMSDAEIYAIIRNADDRWGKFVGRTDRERRLLDLIARVREKYPADEYQTDIIPVYGFQSFMETEVHVEWLIDGLLQEQGYLLLTGPSGVGKTQLTLRVLIAMALGKAMYLGEKITRPCKVAFFSLEMGHADLKFFLATMAKDFSEADRALLEENLILIPYGEAIYLDKEEGRQQVIDVITAIDPDGVVFDSLGSTTSGGLSDENTVKSIMDFNDSLRKRLGIFTWFIHHQRKASGDNKKPNKLSDVYGNQYIVNRATTVLCLWPTNGGKIEVIPLKIRLAAPREPWAITRVGNIDFERTSTVTFITDKPDDTPSSNVGRNFGDI